MKKVILDLCGGTGSWSKPYKEAGYDVRLITLPADIRLQMPPKDVHGILCAPPCTHFAVSGARWFKQKGDAALLDGLSVVDACFRFITLCKPNWWVLENPVGRLVRYIGKPIHYFDPCDYGDPWTKKTGLWGDFNMPPKNRVRTVGKNPIHHCPPGPKRQEIRSMTPQGFAKAFFEANP